MRIEINKSKGMIPIRKKIPILFSFKKKSMKIYFATLTKFSAAEEIFMKFIHYYMQRKNGLLLNLLLAWKFYKDVQKLSSRSVLFYEKIGASKKFLTEFQ